jgi:general secretion pathway protein M
VSLGERFSRLEERERRLLGVLIAIVVAAVLLAPPLALLAVVHSHQSDNEAVREALRSIDDEQVAIARSKANRSAVVERYARPAPPLAAFLSKFASEVGIEIPESQDRQSVPHGKKFDERSTKITLRKVGMLKLLKFMEKIEQSGHPVQIAQINIRKRGSEPDSYDVDMVVSAFDRKEAPKAKADKDAGAEPTNDEDAEEKP